MSEETLYRKVDGKFVAVAKYDREYHDNIPLNCAVLTVASEVSTMRRYNIDPAVAPFVAASMIMEREIVNVILEASVPSLETQPTSRKITYTPEQLEAWKTATKILGMNRIELPSFQQIGERVAKSIREKAEEIMKDKSVSAAYEDFLLLATMGKK